MEWSGKDNYLTFSVDDENALPVPFMTMTATADCFFHNSTVTETTIHIFSTETTICPINDTDGDDSDNNFDKTGDSTIFKLLNRLPSHCAFFKKVHSSSVGVYGPPIKSIIWVKLCCHWWVVSSKENINLLYDMYQKYYDNINCELIVLTNNEAIDWTEANIMSFLCHQEM